MKKLFFTLILMIGVSQLYAQSTGTDITKVLKFTNDNFNMGTIAYGKPTEFNVDIENISTSSITLENVMVSCGCTTPKYTKGIVITPGMHATVTLGFNGSAVGNFTKNATLFFSGNLVKQVSFYGVGAQ
jgi:hypothetical protein